ncbi:recombinase family protein [Harryflintia acetispora]|uniref:recombinase family protein n=1 Tax=Harryflintia acetispora TaxID=1849041 RepID=UPI001897DF1E|nr:recombinase family protein [Harryflintia acetispora]
MARVSRTQTNVIKKQVNEWRVAIYIRLSRDDGNIESYSVKNQREMLLDYVDRYGEDMEIVDIYIDDGFTGTDSDRDAFQRMLDDLKRKRANCVIIKDLSRLSRNYVEAGHYIEMLFPILDVRFICLDPELDSFKHPETVNSMMIAMLNVFNEDFCRQTSAKVRKVFDLKRQKGEFIGGFAPYGYQKDPKNKNKLLVDDEAADVVRNIFQWFMDGMSKYGICQKLNRLGVLCPSLYKKSKGQQYKNPHSNDNPVWSARTIDSILHNQSYIGDMVQGRYRIKSYKIHTQICVPADDWFIVEGTHEPIVSEEVFDTVQNLLKRDTRVAPKQDKLYLFSGFMRCADCDRAMRHQTVRGKHTYYLCRTYKDRGKELCTKHTIREDNLYLAVLTAIQQQVAIAVSMADMVSEINKAPTIKRDSRRLEDAIESKQNELNKIKRYKTNLFGSLQDGDITKEEFRDMKAEFDKKSESLQESIAVLEKEYQRSICGVNEKNQFLAHFMKYQNITELNREILAKLIENIYVQENGNIVIRFRFADEYRLAAEFIENNERLLA